MRFSQLAQLAMLSWGAAPHSSSPAHNLLSHLTLGALLLSTCFNTSLWLRLSREGANVHQPIWVCQLGPERHMTANSRGGCPSFCSAEELAVYRGRGQELLGPRARPQDLFWLGTPNTLQTPPPPPCIAISHKNTPTGCKLFP